MKQPSAANPIENPFIKPHNKTWQLSNFSLVSRLVSPSLAQGRESDNNLREKSPKSSEVEAGEAEVEDHVSFFSEKLLAGTRPVEETGGPRIAHASWLDLYLRNENPEGHHFVIHQHDHPIAGPHYDLRLQCNATSSVSFAIMYGLPGDPNSRRLNRNATETRVHNLWNHLIETASHSTGSMLIWDTGTYTVLPYRDTRDKNYPSDTENSESDFQSRPVVPKTEPEKLHEAFQTRKIRLRLNGTRLPENYTFFLRLSRANDRKEQPKPPVRKRKTVVPSLPESQKQRADSSASEPDLESESEIKPDSTDLVIVSHSPPRQQYKRRKTILTSLTRAESPPRRKRPETTSVSQQSQNSGQTALLLPRVNPTNPTHHATSRPSPLATPFLTSTSQLQSRIRETKEENGSEHNSEQIRLTNTYPGAARNSIHSIHQRKWYLSLDRRGSGFVFERSSKRWVMQPGDAGLRNEEVRRRGRGRSKYDDDDYDSSERAADENMNKNKAPNMKLNSNTDANTTKNEKAKSKDREKTPTKHSKENWPFTVQGVEVERSVVTGRLGVEILVDEGVVEGFVGRKGWRPVLNNNMENTDWIL